MVATAKERKTRPKADRVPIEKSHRAALAPPTSLTVSEWAERNRFLGRESPFPGRWKNALVPYLKGVMDSFSDPMVERIICVFAAQCGKTEIQLNCLGYTIDQDPGTTMVVYDTERSADKVMRKRITPMIMESPALRRHIIGNSDDLGLKEIRFDTSYLFSAWSNSPGALASTPCRYVILDEVDKYTPFSGREGNPIELAVVRTRNFRGRRKILVASTPTLENKYAWSEWLRSDQQRYWVPCPGCHRFQVLDFFKGLKYEKAVSPQEVNERGLAWYVCEHCGVVIRDQEKKGMLIRGRWLPGAMTITAEGKVDGDRPSRMRAGFHLPVLYSPFVPWGEVAAKWIEAKGSGDLSLLMDFFNSWLALPWQERVESLTDSKLKATRREYEPGIVPSAARILTAAVDVQQDHFWYVIRAWGPNLRSWLVRYGTALTWSEVWDAVGGAYPTATGSPMRVRRVVVDSGYRTKEVYNFCRSHYPVTLPVKGSNNPALVATWRMGKPEPGMILFTYKADHFKDQLAFFVSVQPGDPGEWCVPNQTEEDPYFRHMLAERRVIVRNKGRVYSTWQPLSDSAPNHLFDCEVMNVFAAEMLNVRNLGAQEAIGSQSQPANSEERKRDEGWLERESEWIEGGSLWE